MPLLRDLLFIVQCAKNDVLKIVNSVGHNEDSDFVNLELINIDLLTGRDMANSKLIHFNDDWLIF